MAYLFNTNFFADGTKVPPFASETVQGSNTIGIVSDATKAYTGTKSLSAVYSGGAGERAASLTTAGIAMPTSYPAFEIRTIYRPELVATAGGTGQFCILFASGQFDVIVTEGASNTGTVRCRLLNATNTAVATGTASAALPNGTHYRLRLVYRNGTTTRGLLLYVDDVALGAEITNNAVSPLTTLTLRVGSAAQSPGATDLVATNKWYISNVRVFVTPPARPPKVSPLSLGMHRPFKV